MNGASGNREDPHAWLAAIVESSEDAIVSKTLDGIIASWNPSAERMFGYAQDEIVGQPVTRLFPPDRMEEEPQILARLARGERVKHFETVRVSKEGRHFDVSLTLSPVRNAEGTIIGVSKIIRDISELKRSRGEREQLITRLQAALDAVRTLSGLLPVCAWCKKVRDDRGYWEEVTTFLARREGVELTHGICPDCSREVELQLSPAPKPDPG